MTINIIADVAGRYDELMLLLKKMPEADLTVFLGDIPDRGKQTPQVIEYLMKAPKTEVLRGNHDQMMVNACRDRSCQDIWYWNGGDCTVESYGGIDFIPKEHVDWLATRPLYLDLPDLFLSHAPVRSLSPTHLPPRFSQDPRDVGTTEGNFIWNRYPSKQPLEKMTIHGHNSSYKEYKWGNGQLYSICLDHSRRDEIRGIHWNNEADWQLYCQEYLDAKNKEEERAKLWKDQKIDGDW